MTKQVYRVEANYAVRAVFEVVAESEERAQESVSGSPSLLKAKAVGYGLDNGLFEVDPGSVDVEELGEADVLDIIKTSNNCHCSFGVDCPSFEPVKAIRP